MAFVALSLWVLETTGSATYVGLVVMCTTLPTVVLTPLGGVIADRVHRKIILITADVVIGLAMLSLALPFFVFGLSDELALLWLVCAQVIAGAAMAFFLPAIMATIPDVAPRSRLDDANSLFSVSNSLTNVVGSGFAGIMFRIVGGPALFVINGVGFLLSAVSEAFLKLPPPETRVAQSSGFWVEAKDGLSYIRERRGLLNLFLLFMVSNLVYAPVIVALPILVTQFHAQSADWLGYILGAIGVGSMVGLALFTRVNSDGPGRFKWFTICMITQGLTLIAIGATPNGQSAVAVTFFAGMAIAPVNVMFMSILQGTVPRGTLGRVSSIGTLVAGSTMPFGYAIGGLVLDLIDKNAPLMLYVCGASAAAIAAAVSTNRDYREFMSTRISSL
jgi:MFS family permease